MKRYVKANDNYNGGTVLLRSESNDFRLVEESGTGRNDTPWTGLKVVSGGLADKHVVEIKLHTAGRYDYNGEPVTYKYLPEVTIGHGFRPSGENETLAGVEELIRVLGEAVDFSREIEQYIADNEWVYTK